MSNRMRVTPCACVSHDDQNGRLQIELELPGVDKKDIRLEMRSDSFCVTAPRGEDTEYSGCFTPLLHKDAVESTAYPHKKAVSTLLRIPSKSHSWIDPGDDIGLTAIPLWVRV